MAAKSPATSPPRRMEPTTSPTISFASNPLQAGPEDDTTGFGASGLALCEKEPYMCGRLCIVVLGASGDLAKKKTYPALLDLFAHGFLPKHAAIIGYARSAKETGAFRSDMRVWLMKGKDVDVDKADEFLSRCTYFQGQYDSAVDMAKLAVEMSQLESQQLDARMPQQNNRLFYFALPPSAFFGAAQAIKQSALSAVGFNRVIIEKPFGRDLASAQKLAADLNSIFTEDHLYRIDHYLGKEIVQNLMVFRYGNSFLEPIFNRNYVSSVRITFKEPFGTEGRGGYFTRNGIIRDIMQNHLMQVLALVAMEPPTRIQGQEAANLIRNAKVNVIEAIPPVRMQDCLIGQYVGAGDKPGYLEDDSIQEADRERAKYTPTFATVVLFVNTPRWAGVPFIMKAGKALDERKAEIRVQFKEAPAARYMFDGQHCARNELVMRLQPDEAVYMKVNVKTPGLSFQPTQSELDLSYRKRYAGAYNPDAYTRLVLEALRGKQGLFVRGDEVEAAWRIFDPLLKALETKNEVEKKELPLPYAYGSRGPPEADQFLEKYGFEHQQGYQWEDFHATSPKTAKM